MSTYVAASGGLRERNKAKRRNAVLDAALEMLDGPEAAAMTTERIAELAEVSVATVYNLVGTREQLLVALVDRLIEDVVGQVLTSEAAGDPIAALGELIENAVEVLTSRPAAFRQIVLQLTAAANADLHTKLSPSTAAATGIRRAQEAGNLRGDLNPDALAAQVYLSFNGALLRWAAGVLSDSSFRAAALHGLTVVLVASATTASRRALLSDLRQLGLELVG